MSTTTTAAKPHLYRWNKALMMNDYLIMNGGVGQLCNWEIRRLAREMDVTLSKVHVSPVGLAFNCDRQADELAAGVEKHLRAASPVLRIAAPLLIPAMDEDKG